MPTPKIKARFIGPMLLQRTEKLPEGASWLYELKLDAFRAEAIKSGGRVQLRSRNDKDFSARYPAIAQALAAMPDETVIDGEIVALDESGRPSFNALQNHAASTASLFYYVFDVMILAGKDVMNEPLTVRRKLLQEHVLARLGEPDLLLWNVGGAAVASVGSMLNTDRGPNACWTRSNRKAVAARRGGCPRHRFPRQSGSPDPGAFPGTNLARPV